MGLHGRERRTLGEEFFLEKSGLYFTRNSDSLHHPLTNTPQEGNNITTKSLERTPGCPCRQRPEDAP